MNSLQIDYTTVGMIVTWTTAIVAGLRSRVPRIDGPWVVLVTMLAATVASLMFLAPGIPDWVRYALMGWSGAIGGVSLADRFMDKLKPKGDPGGQ